MTASDCASIAGERFQLARWAGATVISTVSGPQKARLARHHLLTDSRTPPAADPTCWLIPLMKVLT